MIEYASEAVYSEGGCAFSGNTIRRCSTAFYLYEDMGPSVVEDNIIEDCEDGISCRYLTSASTITGNTITMGTRWWGWSGIYCYEASPTISSNSIYNYDEGMYLRNNSSPEVTYNTVQNSWRGIYCSSGASPVINNNNIEGNTYGVYNSDNTITINAENNWWGDISGPYHPIDNPGGLGDEVSGNVDCDPWLTSVVTLTLVSNMIR